MLTVLPYLQVFFSIALLISILLQNRGSGLSAAFGGDFGSFHTKRGIEKFLFITSCLLGFLFLANALAMVILS